MKRLWLVLLSLGLVLTFSASVFAVDVRFSGSFFVAGMYQDKTTFIKNGSDTGPSTAFYYQRLRLETDFILAPGLKIITRCDIMKRIWGGQRSDSTITSPDRESAATRFENENIGFDWAYIEYTSPIGMFTIGYQDDGVWGTVFGDSSVPNPMLAWLAGGERGGLFFQVVKMKEKSKTAIYSSTAADNDTDKFQGGIIYKWDDVEAGLLAVYYRAADTRAIDGSLGNIFSLQPYAIFNIGPVKIQTELQYAWGYVKYDELIGQDLKIDNLAGWIDATADFKMFYLGGTAAYVAGNDWHKTDVIKGGFLTGGMAWNPTLLLFNNERNYWAGSIPGNGGSTTANNPVVAAFGIDDTGMYNVWFFQGRIGVRPIDKLDIMASVSYAKADSKTWVGNLFGDPDFVSDDYGTEVDVIATYKITNNLSYMVGAGYLFTGNYFKGTDPNADVNNNFIVINKLTLTF